MLWELLFMLVVLKIPVVYLCAVVWWAIRAEPRPLEGAETVATAPPSGPCDWRRRFRSRPRTPRGGAGARIGTTRAAAAATARARRAVAA